MTMAHVIRERSTGHYLIHGHSRDALAGAAQCWSASEDCALEFPDAMRATQARVREGIPSERVEVRERTPRQAEADGGGDRAR